MCLKNGIRFVGPSPDVMYKMGNKTEARKAALEAGDDFNLFNRNLYFLNAIIS